MIYIVHVSIGMRLYVELWKITLTAFEGTVVGDAEVLEHVGVAGEQWRGEGQEGCAGGEKDSGEPGHDF
jgi:hypothetical protein